MQQLQSLAASPGPQPGQKALVVFFETDCPTCQLALPYLNSLAVDSVQVIGISQDGDKPTREFIRQLDLRYPVHIDQGLTLSRAYEPQSVPTMFLLDESRQGPKTVSRSDRTW